MSLNERESLLFFELGRNGKNRIHNEILYCLMIIIFEFIWIEVVIKKLQSHEWYTFYGEFTLIIQMLSIIGVLVSAVLGVRIILKRPIISLFTAQGKICPQKFIYGFFSSFIMLVFATFLDYSIYSIEWSFSDELNRWIVSFIPVLVSIFLYSTTICIIFFSVLPQIFYKRKYGKYLSIFIVTGLYTIFVGDISTDPFLKIVSIGLSSLTCIVLYMFTKYQNGIEMAIGYMTACYLFRLYFAVTEGSAVSNFVTLFYRRNFDINMYILVNIIPLVGILLFFIIGRYFAKRKYKRTEV